MDKGVPHSPGGMERDGVRFRRATQNGAQSKVYKLFISGTFRVLFLDHSRSQVPRTIEIEITDTGGPPYQLCRLVCRFYEILISKSTWNMSHFTAATLLPVQVPVTQQAPNK